MLSCKCHPRAGANAQEIAEFVKDLRNFYAHSFIHLAASIVAFLIWALFSSGAYWPLWVHLTSVAILLIEGYRADIIQIKPSASVLYFFDKNWEKDMIDKMSQKKNPMKPTVSKKVVATAKTQAKTKSVEKKETVKKPLIKTTKAAKDTKTKPEEAQKKKK